MQRDQVAVVVSIIATFVAGAALSLVPNNWAWGLNHLQFLPSYFMWIYLSLATLATAVLLLPVKMTGVDLIITKTNRLLWGEKHWLKVAIALAFVPLFYFLRVETHFLGDGYSWLSNLSHQEGYVQKWTALGSLATVRFVQSMIGSASEQTALVAFQIVSILSGAITLYNLFSIVGRVCTDLRLRIFGLIVIISGGTMLLFCGYVEVYPVFWAVATTWLSLSIRYLQERKGLTWVILVFAVSLLMQVQTIYLIIGFIWVVAGKLFTRRRFLTITRPYWLLIGLIAISGGGILYWLRTGIFELETMLLPLYLGRFGSPDYAVFSLKHLVDIANLSLLIVPVCLPLLFLSRPWKWLGRLDSVTIFLALTSFGSLFFLLVFDPIIGLGRDWDLASLTILCPALLLLSGCQLIEIKPTLRVLVASLLLGLTFGGSYLAVNLNAASSEKRYHSLLSLYGSKDYSGWVFYSNYLRHADRTKEADTLFPVIDSLFPNEVLLTQAIDKMKSGDANGALAIALKIADEDPYNAASLTLIGQVYSSRRQFSKAEEYLNRALRLSPYFPTIFHSLAQVYIGQQRYSKALAMTRKAYAGAPEKENYLETHAMALFYNNQFDSLKIIANRFLTNDSCDARGNLLLLRVAVAQRNRSKAKEYYRAFEACGPTQPEYQNVLSDFRSVMDD